MFAAEGNPNPDVISTLLKAGAGIDSTISDGRTALMLAAQFNQNPEIVTALLRAGANGKLKSKAGKTAYDYAEENEKLKGTMQYLELKEAQF